MDQEATFIIVSIGKFGIVEVHKAYENLEDGSFIIQKTWKIEQLESIESFTNDATAYSVADASEAQSDRYL